MKPGIICRIHEFAGKDLKLQFYQDRSPDLYPFDVPKPISAEQVIAILVRRGWVIVDWRDRTFELRAVSDGHLSKEREGLIKEISHRAKDD